MNISLQFNHSCYFSLDQSACWLHVLISQCWCCSLTIVQNLHVILFPRFPVPPSTFTTFILPPKKSIKTKYHIKKVKEKCRFCDPFWRIPSSVGVNGLGDGSTDRVGKYWEMNWCIVGLTVVSGDMLTTTKYKHLQWYPWNVIEKTEYSTCCQIFSAIAANIGYKSSLGLIFILRCVDNVRRSTLIHWELSSYYRYITHSISV